MAWYEIYIDNGSGRECIYRPGDCDLVLEDVHFRPVMGGAGSLEFNIARNHPFYVALKPLSTTFWVVRDGVDEFRGRYIGSETDFQRTGHITVEGDLNYLLDSMQDPFTFTGTLQTFFSGVITNHNGMVETKKRYTVGICNVAAGTVTVESSEYISSLGALSMLVDTYGGYLRVRHENGNHYIDYVTDYGGSNTQKVMFGENLADLARSRNAAEIVTCLIPLGAEVEVSNPDGTTTKKRVDISSVNGGLKYVTSQSGVDKYGQIWGTQVFDNVADPETLKRAGIAYLQEQIVLPDTLELSAIDLSLVDADIAGMKIGLWTTVESRPHEISQTYLLKEMDINITAPEQSTISLGGNTASIALSTAKGMQEVSRAVQELTTTTSREIAEKISNATSLITGGLGGYVLIGRSADGHPEEILIMDAPTKDRAVNVIRLNKNGIGFSRTGYAGTYRNAWTIDGNLVADFITSGTMSADRVRGGTLEAGGVGAGRTGKIRVLDSQGNEIGTWDRNGLNVAAGKIKGSKIVVDGRLAPINYEEQYENYGDPEVAPGGDDPGEILPAVAEEIVPAEATELPDWIRDEKSEMTGAIEVYDKFGNIIGRWDADGLHVTKGVIDGPDIKSSNIFGAGIVIGGTDYGNGYILVQSTRGSTLFKANNAGVKLGGFKVYKSDASGATYLALEDETVGMGDSSEFAFWAGTDSEDPEFRVKQNGKIYCDDMGPDWAGYSVGEAIKWIWDHWPGPERNT